MNFLQSKQWFDFQKALGRKVWMINNVLVIKHDLPFGKSYLYSPRCGEDFLSDSFLKKIKEIGKKEKAIFLKVEPKGKKISKKFKKSSNLQPSKTLILDIKNDLLKSFHHKTRYNIRLAEKKGIKIRKEKNLEEFWRLIQKTSERDKFRFHEKEYYEKLLQVPGVEMFLAEHSPELQSKCSGCATRSSCEIKFVVAVNIVGFFKDFAIYLHGASDYDFRNLMSPYLLQWEQIKEAKKKDCKFYDFWGIDEKKWPGVTRFKKGFNGKEVKYIGAYDLVLNPVWYLIYNLAKKLAKKLTRY